MKDYYSKFPFVRKLNRKTSTEVIRHLKTIFSEHGIPVIMYSDNGPRYDSHEFAAFADAWDFEHITSTPEYQQSNGLAENTVKVMKKVIRCSKDRGEDPELAFLFLRSTPLSSHLPSPAELLYERPIRSLLPQCFKFDMNNENTRAILRQRQATQKKYYDRGSRELSELQAGDYVMLQDRKNLSWQPATVVENSKEPRSYMVQTNAGSRYRRNRRYLRPLPEVTGNDEGRANDPYVGGPGADKANDPYVRGPEADPDVRGPVAGRADNPISPVPASPRRSTRQRSVPEHLKDYDLE